MAQLKQITPFVLVSDMGASLSFFETVLGFKCTFQADNYAFERRSIPTMASASFT